VIQVREARNRESPVFCKVAEEKKQRHGIGTTGKSNEHTGAWWTKRMALHRSADALMEL
jgi:hypothetical protein